MRREQGSRGFYSGIHRGKEAPLFVPLAFLPFLPVYPLQPPAAAGDGGSCFTLFDFFKIYPYRFLAKSLSGRNLRSGNNTEGASPGELHTVRDYGIRAKEGADGGTGRSEELGLSTAVQPSNGDLTYIPGTFPASSLPD